MSVKACNCCGIVKSFDDFEKNSSRKGGITNRCKACKYEQGKSAVRKWQSAHREEMREYSRKSYKRHSSEKSEWQKEYFKQNKEHVRQIKRKSAEKCRDGKQAYKRDRYQKDVQFRLSECLRARLRVALKNDSKVGSAVRDLGCSIAHLKTHLEKHFLPGMTWDNKDLWHIDHIVPLAWFDLTNREQFLSAVHYTNLQPMWASDNCRKGANLETN